MDALEKSKANTIVTWDTGTIKFFDPVRRWGFILPDDGYDDVFLPWTTLQDSGIRESHARIGVRVMYVAEAPDHPGRRPKAIRMRLMR
jgi:cold shock CspA family protein